MCTLNCTLKINRVLLICCVLTVSFGVKSKSTVLSSVALGLTGDFERELQQMESCVKKMSAVTSFKSRCLEFDSSAC